MSLWLQNLAPEKTIPVILAVGVLAALDLVSRYKHEDYHYIFGALLGTILSIGFLSLSPLLFGGEWSKTPYMVALAVVMFYSGWRLLFGPWEAHVKATVLGTFVFWISLHTVLKFNPGLDRLTIVLSMVFALIPAAFWCILFLPYHREKLSRVFLMFFAGMTATAPILFYDALVRRGSELHFFYLRITPESFSSATQSFVSGQLQASPSVQTALLTVAISFILVALVEEGSKYWVLRKSGDKLFGSIDEVVELAIIVAIGFAFAENILNTSYFPSFVRQYLLTDGSRNWFAFLGNTAGRSVLTSMVHIASTGILGYFVGRAIFASQLLKTVPAGVVRYPVTDAMTRLLKLPPVQVFRSISIVAGFAFAVGSHALANFLVTVPDVLPSHPRTLGDLLGSGTGSIFNSISLVIIPSLLYVVGGFLLITWLLDWKQNREERGRLFLQESFVQSVD